MKFLLFAAISTFSADAVKFNCYFDLGNLSGYVEELGSIYFCWPSVGFTGSTVLEDVVGDHLPGYKNDNVGWLRIYNLNLPFFPQGIEMFFTNLKTIDLANLNLLSLNAEDLKPFPQIVLFVVHGNNLPSIDGNLFKYTPLVKYINLRNNRIEHIGKDLTKNLNLQTLYLDRNVCVNENAFDRAAIAELSSKLPTLCQSLEPELPIDECSCSNEIEVLRTELAQQAGKIQQLSANIDQLLQAIKKLSELNSSEEF